MTTSAQALRDHQTPKKRPVRDDLSDFETPLLCEYNQENIVIPDFDLPQNLITEKVLIAAAGNVEHGRDVMEILLELCPKAPVTAEVIEMAARNGGNGAEVIVFLLERRNDLTINEEVMEAATGNWSQGEKITAHLLDRFPQIPITAATVKSAAGNRGQGVKPISLLFEKRQNIPVTEEALREAISIGGKEITEFLICQLGTAFQCSEGVFADIASRFPEDTMKIFLDAQPKVPITEAIVAAAATNGWGKEKVVDILFKSRGIQIPITETVLETAARNSKVLKTILTRTGIAIPNSTRVLIPAAEFWNPKELADLFNKHDMQVTEGVFEAAARNTLDGEKVMAYLLKKINNKASLKDTVFKAATRNWEKGEKIMSLLLERAGLDFEIPEEVIAGVARHFSHKLLSSLLCIKGVQITGGMVEAAANNTWQGDKMMKLLLENWRPDPAILDAVVEAAAKNTGKGDKIMGLLLKKLPNIEMKQAVIESAVGNIEKGQKVMKCLLKHQRFEVTPTVLALAAGNRKCGTELVKLLLHPSQIKECKTKTKTHELLANLIDEKVIRTAIRNRGQGEEIVQLLLQKREGRYFPYPDCVLVEIAERLGVRAMSVCLERWSEIQVTEDVVKAAARNLANGKDVLDLLLQKWPNSVTEGILIAAAENHVQGDTVIECLFKKLGNAPITERVLLAAANNWGKGDEIIMLLLGKKNAKVPVSEELVAKLAKSRSSKVIKKLLHGHNAGFFLIEETGNRSSLDEKCTSTAPTKQEGSTWPMKIETSSMTRQNAHDGDDSGKQTRSEVPLLCLHSEEMVTVPLLEWSDIVADHQDQLSDWVVTDVDHMKSFHFSSVEHEFLRFVIKQRGVLNNESHFVFAERMVDKDDVTVGWKPVRHPKLMGWWLMRLFKGYFGDAQHGVPGLASSSSVTRWKAVGYSGSDYLCRLRFVEPLLSVSELRHVLINSSYLAPKYSATSNNCYWFAYTVYETLKKGWPCSEFRNEYYKHRSIFAVFKIK
ncbi:uncharacterized protein F4812DRAFT_412214 [Daldinia caldariorum]|uniref:uncharacterized protein n=1 Tax=Daldinia caldariorum TaxID=326644 RepID=UPI0020079D74|nr:uncharacterized protein F4812DRAFT_412214 [Daldinia caldariorum]KAI1473278.1 hypothetical protein F4812DRAFT_412214 [Daldinia caldariorum]